MLVLVGGCFGTTGDEAVAEHFVPEHWPSDLVDAADKLQERVGALGAAHAGRPADSGQPPAVVFGELRDIVGWVPEIAADTDLTEEQWVPIHRASESLSRRLRRVGAQLDPTTLSELDRYHDLLRDRASLLVDDVSGDLTQGDAGSELEPTVEGESVSRVGEDPR